MKFHCSRVMVAVTVIHRGRYNPTNYDSNYRLVSTGTEAPWSWALVLLTGGFNSTAATPGAPVILLDAAQCCVVHASTESVLSVRMSPV